MTIEERIGLCDHCLTDTTRLCHSDCHYYSKYLGATEQKALDNTEHTEEMRKLNEEWQENLEIQRRMLIDKASRWLQENLDFGTPAYREQFVKDFIEAMEED